jgi:hypothetical protein
MVKSSKKSKKAAPPDNVATAPGNAASSNPATARPVKSAPRRTPAAKPVKAKERPKSAGKPARRTDGKPPAAPKLPAATAIRKTRRAGHVLISDEDIRIRAYFISEQRMHSGVPGDSAHDWLEARRQLQEEAGQSA